MKPWIAYIGIGFCVLVAIWAIFAPASIFDKWKNGWSMFLKRGFIRHGKTVTAMARTSDVENYKEVLSIQRQEPSNRPSVLSQIISTICSFIIITYGLILLNFWRIGKLTMQINLYWFLFLVFFIAFPIFIILDTYVWERKYYKLGKSAVEKHETITLYGDIDKIFYRCLKVIRERIKLRKNSRILKMEKPKFIKALIGGSIITIETRQVEKDVTEIYCQSDSQWLTAKFDWGTNQRNVDKFECLILTEVGQ